eukprot:TRINITY_DN45927_c0_g1_i1.p1 TRINITY_DN45927_c0_g1~~TRINITY_DN45927_c0_g1_i1.p1  ORF type:complete len:238 (+),score=56.27 TRINITY_DN45927_c0_g1_i1:1040-1753(+)
MTSVDVTAHFTVESRITCPSGFVSIGENTFLTVDKNGCFQGGLGTAQPYLVKKIVLDTTSSTASAATFATVNRYDATRDVGCGEPQLAVYGGSVYLLHTLGGQALSTVEASFVDGTVGTTSDARVDAGNARQGFLLRLAEGGSASAAPVNALAMVPTGGPMVVDPATGTLVVYAGRAGQYLKSVGMQMFPVVVAIGSANATSFSAQPGHASGYQPITIPPGPRTGTPTPSSALRSAV